MPPGSATISYRLAPAPPRLTFIVSVGSPSPSSPLRSHFILGMLQLSKKKKKTSCPCGVHMLPGKTENTSVVPRVLWKHKEEADGVGGVQVKHV